MVNNKKRILFLTLGISAIGLGFISLIWVQTLPENDALKQETPIAFASALGVVALLMGGSYALACCWTNSDHTTKQTNMEDFQ